MERNEFDAVVVGSGPNGLAAAITLQQAGLSVLLVEAAATTGGGLRTAELTLPGFQHDVCSAIHPLAAASPFFTTLPLQDYGLEYIYPTIPAAHAMDNGKAAFLQSGIGETAMQFPPDKDSYIQLMAPLVQQWADIAADVLGPLRIPKHPLAMMRFGRSAITSALHLSGRFKTTEARALWAGMAAHAIQPLSHAATSAVALVLMVQGHVSGWPLPRGGSGAIARALTSYFLAIGGKVETNFYVKHLHQLPPAKAVLLDVTPRQLLQIAGEDLSRLYRWQLKRYHYGMGVFKIDWALDSPVPFQNEGCRNAGTVHLGGTLEEIAAGEENTWKGTLPQKPFVLLAQQSIFDPTRAPEGKHTAWAYCHVPNGSAVDMTDAIEEQVERFAPGFHERILSRHTFNAQQLQEYNPNYIGGDINGGALNLSQLFTRPALRFSPYRTSAKGIYICSSSTPPGGGVHGMCGYYAACRALRDVFKLPVPSLMKPKSGSLQNSV